MMPGDWIGVSLFMALSSAGFILVSEYFKVRPIASLFWMRFMGVVLMLPLPFFMQWPQSISYYTFVALASVLYGYVDIYIIVYIYITI